MKKIFLLSLALCMLAATLSMSACSNADPSQVQYEQVSMDQAMTQYGPLALINDTHEYKFPAAASKSLANIWEYRAAHTEEGKTAAYKSSFNTLLLDSAALSSMHEWLTAFNLFV